MRAFLNILVLVGLACAFAAAAPAETAPNAGDNEDKDLVPAALIEASRDSFVVVETDLQKDTSEPLVNDDGDYRIQSLYSKYVDQKRPAEAAGLVLDDKGTVITYDSGLDDRYIKAIRIVDGNQSIPARKAKLLYDAPALILQADPNAAGNLKPLAFAPLVDEGVNTVLYQSALRRVDDHWRLQFSGSRPSLAKDPARGDNVYYGGSTHAPARPGYGSPYESGSFLHLVTDANGQPVGCATLPQIDLQQNRCVWKGPDLLKAEGIEWSKLVEAERACRAKMLQCVHEVVLVLRQGEAGEMEDRYRRHASGSGAAGREISQYGIAISDTDILVLGNMTSTMARQIERIYIKHSPSRRQEARFVGALKRIGAFVVRVDKGKKLPAQVELATEDPARMRPFWTARLRKRLGEKYADLSTNRLLGKVRGYEGRFVWYPAREIQSNSLLVDFRGRVIGMHVHEKKEHEEEQALEASRRWYSRGEMERIFTISELRGMLTDPNSHRDPKVEVTTKTLAKRRPWFGVEFVPVSPALAEMLKVETPTRDGQIGFLVNAVYENSPAEAAKLRVGDILLKIQGPATPYPVELAARYAGDYRSFRGGWWGGYGGDEGEGPVEPTWKNRRNFLTQALDAIGVGKTVKITCYHPKGKGKGETRAIDYTIELAPPDQDSADRWKNRKLGLTVKDVTYEVGYALGLKGPAQGVLVSKVESGSPAQIAKIFPNEIVTRVDGRPIAGARAMRDRIAAASKAGRDKVRVTVLRLGKTRQADLAIDEYDPDDDEGLDED